MEVEPGAGWADVVDKILRTGKNNPDSGKILSKALRIDRKEQKKQSDEEDENEDQSESDKDDEEDPGHKGHHCDTLRLKPDPQKDALLENELKSDATRGVVHLFNAVKTVNPKSDKKKKRKKRKKKNTQKKFKR